MYLYVIKIHIGLSNLLWLAWPIPDRADQDAISIYVKHHKVSLIQNPAILFANVSFMQRCN